jgi:hypothetical protein
LSILLLRGLEGSSCVHVRACVSVCLVPA